MTRRRAIRVAAGLLMLLAPELSWARDNGNGNGADTEVLRRVEALESTVSDLRKSMAVALTTIASLEASLEAERTARTASHRTLHATLDDAARQAAAATSAVTPTTEAFFSRVPFATLAGTSLNGGLVLPYTDVALNTESAVFDMASDGTLTILQAGIVSVDASLQLEYASGGTVRLLIYLNGIIVHNAYLFRPHPSFGIDTLTSAVTLRVNAGDQFTFGGLSSNPLTPPWTLVDGFLTAEWNGLDASRDRPRRRRDAK